MSDLPEKEKIDIDELVDFLVKRRDESAPTVADEPSPQESDEILPVILPEPVIPHHEEHIPEPETTVVASQAPAEESFLILGDEDEDESEKKEDPQSTWPEELAELNVLSVSEPEQENAESAEDTAPDESPAPAKKKRRLFGFLNRKKDEDEDEDDWEDWGLKPIGHYRIPDEETSATHVEMDMSASAEGKTAGTLENDEFPEVKSVSETITMQVVLPSGAVLPRQDAATRVLPAESSSADAESVPQPVPEVKEVDDQLPDQLSLEEMVRVEDIEPDDGSVHEDEREDPEERLQRAREEKARYFTIEEEEPNEPEEEVVEEEYEEEEDEPVAEDFTGYQDAKTVAEDLAERCRTSLTGLLFTGLLELALLVLTVLTYVTGEPPLGGAMGYLVTHAFILILMMGLNYTAIGRGFSGLFMLRANSDTAPALASVTALLNVFICFANTETALPYWTPLAGMLLTLCAAGRYARAVGVRRNFAFVSYPGDKYAATLIEEENAVQEIGRRAAGTGEATVGYFHRTDFLSDYLANANEDDRGDEWSRWMTPAAFGLSLLLSLIAFLGEGVNDFWTWLPVFVGMVCVSMQATQLAIQLPLNHCSCVMLSRGGFLVGWKAVRQFGDLDALVVDIADLYPDESMLLHGIKTFSGAHIDDAILTAASLAVRSGGPLAMIFRRIIENKENLLHDVDSLVYEQGMGLSGWVDGRRVFVGNRRLLQNHGVDVPSLDYEARYAKDGRRLVYLSMGGQLSAMFVVSYLPDPEIQDALQDLCRSRVTLLVRSCDPNITTQDLCDSFALDEYYVDVLPAAAGRAYMQLAERTNESMPAVMASNGHILGTAWALSVCRSLRTKGFLALLAQTLAAALGLFLCLIWALEGPLDLLRLLLVCLVSLLATWIVPLFKRT